MKTKKPHRPLCLLLLICCLSIAGNAQESLPESRWTLGMDFGIPLSVECEKCDNRSTVSSTVGINASYRLVKWLSLNANTSYFRIDAIKHEWIGGFEFHASEAILQTDALSMSIGPQFLFRLGQGDLSMELRYGLVVNYTSMAGYDSKNGNFSSNTSNTSVGTSAFRIAYTYWPQHRFGIQFGLEAADNQFPDVFVPFFNQQYNESFNTRLVAARGFTQINLVLGAQYRF